MTPQVICLVSAVFIGSSKSHSMVAEYKNLDKKVKSILFFPTSEEKWDIMLQTVEYYVIKIMNYGLRISQGLETDKKQVQKIVNNGKPSFLKIKINEQELMEESYIPYDKIQEFYRMKEELESTWVEFLKIAKSMKWQKVTRKPYIVQGAFHGRRLGKRKGRNKPYSLEQKEDQPEEESFDVDTKELDFSKDEYYSN